MRAAITIVTHALLPAGAPDDRLLGDALARLGWAPRFAVWNDPAVDWAATGLTVVRSPWDYHLHPGPWRAWVDRVAAVTRLANPPDVIRWNTDKRYLVELSAGGVACVPTLVVEDGASAQLAGIAAAQGWGDVVVKPTVGASAHGARRFAGSDLADAGQAHLSALAADGGALVQPFIPSVERARERCLVFLGGRFSHAFTKPPFASALPGESGEVPHQPDRTELALAEAALAAAPGPVLYARVDMVPGPDGPLLMELELIEPDLGMRFHPGAVERLAELCAAMAG